jgi:hypothetical protein
MRLNRSAKKIPHTIHIYLIRNSKYVIINISSHRLPRPLNIL